jgi:hypothetical protein
MYSTVIVFIYFHHICNILNVYTKFVMNILFFVQLFFGYGFLGRSLVLDWYGPFLGSLNFKLR